MANEQPPTATEFDQTASNWSFSVPEEERVRRESNLRKYTGPVKWYDPFTWSTPSQTAGLCFGGGFAGSYLWNFWNKKPAHFALVPRLMIIGGSAVIGYGVGKLREHRQVMRDAIIDHYIQLHPEEFENLNNYSGRKFGEIIQPWYPNRVQEVKLADKK